MRNSTFVAGDLWEGRMETEPGGDHTTCGCVVSGQLRLDFGSQGTKSVGAGPGDFFTVPPNTMYREVNACVEEQVIVGARS